MLGEVINSVPSADGYYMPSEGSKHEGCWILWPSRGDTWRLNGEPAQECFAEVALAISKYEKVTIGANASEYEKARNILPEYINIEIIGNNDSWVRDTGPTFVINKESNNIRGIDWEFNAWGGDHDGLYFPWDKDNEVGGRILGVENIGRYKAEFVMEGGSFHTDGEGTLITTEECLLSQGRNPQLTKPQIEHNLKSYLGVEKVIWLFRGIYEDETNGHVDNICCFAAPGVVILAWTDDTQDPQYEISAECYDILSGATDAKGRKLIIHKLCLPQPLYMTQEEADGIQVLEGFAPRQPGMRLPASYVNFYLPNNALLMPLFDHPNDLNAKETLSAIFPQREIVGIKAREILLGGGNIHCITLQQPFI